MNGQERPNSVIRRSPELEYQLQRLAKRRRIRFAILFGAVVVAALSGAVYLSSGSKPLPVHRAVTSQKMLSGSLAHQITPPSYVNTGTTTSSDIRGSPEKRTPVTLAKSKVHVGAAIAAVVHKTAKAKKTKLKHHPKALKVQPPVQRHITAAPAYVPPAQPAPVAHPAPAPTTTTTAPKPVKQQPKRVAKKQTTTAEQYIPPPPSP